LAVDSSRSISPEVPESASRKILLPCIALGVVEHFAVVKGVVVHSLKGPFSDEDRKFSISCCGGFATRGGSHVARVSTGSSEPVEVRVDDQVGASSIEWCPERFTLEAVLKHDWDTLVNGSDLLEDASDVGVDPVSAVRGETSGRSESGKVTINTISTVRIANCSVKDLRVRSLVDRGNGECVEVARALHESENSIDSLERPVQVGGVVEPLIVAESLADIKAVDATWEGVQANHTVHIIFLNCICCYCSKIRLLVAVVQSRARHIDPGSICGRNTESVDADGSQFVDGTSVEVRSIASLEDRTTLSTEILA
jgi:hypothetical protein